MPLHVSNTVVLIIRRSNCIMQHLVSSHSVDEYNKLIIKQEFVHYVGQLLRL